MAARPERYNCETCEVRRREGTLWAENAEALDLYQVLGLRIVSACELAPAVVSRWMAGRTWEDVVGLLTRLNVIHEVLTPDADDGRSRHHPSPSR